MATEVGLEMPVSLASAFLPDALPDGVSIIVEMILCPFQHPVAFNCNEISCYT